MTGMWPTESYGLVDPTSFKGSISTATVKYGEGLFIKIGTTNLITNPSFDVGTTGWTSAATLTTSSTHIFMGAQSMKIAWPTAAANATSAVFTFASTLATSTSHTFSANVYVPTGDSPVQLVVGGAGANATTSVATTIFDGWVRLTVTFTTTANAGTVTVGVRNTQATVLGMSAYLDATQLEDKAFATPYTDGSRGSAWNAPGNLLPAAAQSFEDGTTGGWVIVGDTGILTLSTAQFYTGIRSLLYTHTGAAQARGQVGMSYTMTGLTVGKVYSFSGRSYTTGSGVQPYLAVGGVTDNSPDATVISGWSQLAVTFIATATSHILYVFNSAQADPSEFFYIDALRFEEGTGAATYRWTGAEGASTSVRVADHITFALPVVTSATGFSFAGFAIVQPEDGRVLLTLKSDSSNRISVETTSSGSIAVTTAKAGVTTAGPSVALGAVDGDLVFFGGTCTSAGVLTLYTNKNGGAVSSAVSTNTAFADIPVNLVEIGHLNGLFQANAVIEQILAHNSTLSAGEMSQIAFSGEATDFEDDGKIVFAAITPTTNNNRLKALSRAGKGLDRLKSKVRTVVQVEQGVEASSTYYVPGATHTVYVTPPATSGVGVGDHIVLDGNLAYTVRSVFNTGVQEVLYISQTTTNEYLDLYTELY